MKKSVVVAAVAAASAAAHTCVHDAAALPRKPERGAQAYAGHPFASGGSGRRLAADDDFSPMRIHFELMDQADTDADTATYEFLRDTLLPDTVAKLEATLSVVPVDGSLTLADGNTACDGGAMSLAVPDGFYEAGGGTADTDFVLFVTAKDTDDCADGVLAYAGACATDQYDRPTHGICNFCPDEVDTADYDGQLATSLHEFTHALGFSSAFWPLFRYPDGSPMTARDDSGDPLTTDDYECPSGSTLDGVEVPDADTLDVSTERGVLVSKMATPTVRTVAAQFFDCGSLGGAEIENQPTSSGVCFGSHWEERLFPNEFMSPVASTFSVFSNLTLALLEDSGWYRADYAQAETLLVGRNQGCAAATDKCIGDDGEPVYDGHFCVEDAADGCTADRMAIGYCNIATYSGDLPSEYQYFSDATLGGGQSNADYCPYMTGYSNRYCTDSSQDDDIRGSVYHEDGSSRCHASTLVETGWTTSAPEAGCYPTTCADNGTMYWVHVGGAWRECTDSASSISVSGYSGALSCADPEEMCVGVSSTTADDLGDDDVLSGAGAARAGLLWGAVAVCVGRWLW